MTVSTTTRLGITRWDAGTDAFTRSDMDDSHANLEARAAGYSQAASRPAAAAAYAGFFHFSATGILTYCDGSQWYDVATAGPTVVDLTAASGVVGTATTFARSDHRHGIAASAITTAMIQDNAVTTAKITDNNVTLAKLVDSAAGYAVLGKAGTGSGDFAEITAGDNTVLRRDGSGNLAFGTLSTAHIADAQITTAKIGGGQVTLAKMATDSVDSDQYVDGSIDSVHLAPDIVDGTKIADDSIDSEHYVDASIDTQHIANNQVTVAKIETVAAHSILARVGSTTGDLSELAAGTDSVLRRDGSGNLAFGTIDGGHIGNDTIDSQHYAAGSIDSEHLAADVIDSTKLADNAVNSEHYVDGSIERVHLEADIIDGTKIANDVINSEHYVNNSIDGEHLNTNLYNGGTWQGALSGNAATASRWSSYRTITLGGDLTGSVQIRGDANVTLNGYVAANSVALGTDTTGNYMAGVSAGTGVSVSHTPGEGSTATVSIGQAVATNSNVTFNKVTLAAYEIEFGTNQSPNTHIAFTAGNDLSMTLEGVFSVGYHKTISGFSGSTLTSAYNAHRHKNHLIPMDTSTSSTTGYLLGEANNAWNRVVTKNGSYLSSDATLKDIGGTAPGMDFVRMLTGYEWSWKGDGEASFWGPTAQDVQAAVDAAGSDAELVSGEEGNLTVRMDALWGPVINALKELEERIVALGG